jgi:hypothetical protein
MGIDVAKPQLPGDELPRDGATAIFVAVDESRGRDSCHCRPGEGRHAEALAALKKDKIRVVMLTGDNADTAEAVAAETWHRRGRSRGAARSEGAVVLRLRNAKAASSRWPATG